MIEQLYGQHQKTLHERAWRWAQRTNREVGDMLGVCHEAFMEAVRLYEPERGAKFNSLLATMCNQSLGEYCKHTDQPPPEEFDNDTLPSPQHVVEQVAWRELYTRLSTEAREVVDIILESPAELLALVTERDTTGHKLRNAAEKLLWANKHMTRVQLAPLFTEIQSALEVAR